MDVSGGGLSRGGVSSHQPDDARRRAGQQRVAERTADQGRLAGQVELVAGEVEEFLVDEGDPGATGGLDDQPGGDGVALQDDAAGAGGEAGGTGRPGRRRRRADGLPPRPVRP